MKKYISILLVIVMMVAYGIYTYRVDHKPITGHAPTITVPDGVLKVKTSAKDKALLKGVKATDAEDGNLTKKLYIESLSSFGENNIRQITIGVFDSDDNLTRVTREVQYTDYKAPKITLKKALIYTNVYSKSQFADYVKATSSVDGDISSNVSVVREYVENEEIYVTFQVKDSTGTKTTLTLKADSVTREQTLTIKLKKYLIHVKKGQTVFPRSYIKSIKMGSISQTAVLRNRVNCTPSNFTATKKGTYEIFYKLTTTDGDYGVTKLVVVVD